MTTIAASSQRPPRECDAVRHSDFDLTTLDQRSAAAARDWAVDQAAEWGVRPDGIENVRLVVSELVTNAVRHTSGPPCTAQLLLIHQENGAVRVEVRDCGREDGAGPAVIGHEDTELFAESGRGLTLVAAFSNEWGVHEIVPGYPALGHVVWAHPEDACAPVPVAAWSGRP